jgi:hypothetical protein
MGSPYRLSWQWLLSCELRFLPADSIWHLEQPAWFVPLCMRRKLASGSSVVLCAPCPRPQRLLRLSIYILYICMLVYERIVLFILGLTEQGFVIVLSLYGPLLP